MLSTVSPLTQQERQMLHAVGCGLRDPEIAACLGLPEPAVRGMLGHLLAKLGLPDRSAAIVYAFDSGVVVPGRGPRRPGVHAGCVPVAAAVPVPVPVSAVPAPVPVSTPVRDPQEEALRICLLGPLQAWRDGRPVDLGPARQQSVLAALALSPGRALGPQELLDGVWGMEAPMANVVPVYVYRLRKILAAAAAGQPPVISRDRCGYRLAGAVSVDAARVERHATAAAAAARTGDLAEAVRLTARALDLFRGEPLAGLPGPLAELERMRLTERRNLLVRRKVDGQLRLGRHTEAIDELSALSVTQPLDESVAAMLMCALQKGGRPAAALEVFDRTSRHLAAELATAPSDLLRRARRAVLRGDTVLLDPAQAWPAAAAG
ncbi:BTAD domain-containing putative transcriptional regulator [Actinacidiphila sp. bgisy144]|uniref:BTAD domain-containing putative transcriptional regulator n=1 Tax=unclassified Actinacidiphila TaxID=2995708 RepID=UPI003EB827F5